MLEGKKQHKTRQKRATIRHTEARLKAIRKGRQLVNVGRARSRGLLGELRGSRPLGLESTPRRAATQRAPLDRPSRVHVRCTCPRVPHAVQGRPPSRQAARSGAARRVNLKMEVAATTQTPHMACPDVTLNIGEVGGANRKAGISTSF
jgi:hypothetical protein